MESNKQAFKAITRICLNNWHYIDAKILELNENINFFTGHSGSGKSTVIDAMQIVLYANTDGRGFFNKAAADDSDRSLIEYLRGMINIKENGQAEYKRNANFSTTIVLELTQTLSRDRECVGVVFDVDVATNEYNRLFFWFRGELPDHGFRTAGRVMTISEVREWIQRTYEKEDYFYTANNERFRRNLYDIYLGGLDEEKFPRLFKRAIPFRMNIKLEDFVKEYICMEQDIHIEDMQESVVLYGRMRRKIKDTREELEQLNKIEEQYGKYRNLLKGAEELRYRRDSLSIKRLEQNVTELMAKAELHKEDVAKQEESLEKLERLKEACKEHYDEINRQIAGSGYVELEAQKQSLQEHTQLLSRSCKKWEEMVEGLKAWEKQEEASNQILWDIEAFRKKQITGEELDRLKKSLSQVREEAEKQRQELGAEKKSLQKEEKQLEQDLSLLRLGKKAYPKELEQAQSMIRRGLYEKTGKDIPVRILADLLDIPNEKWRNAIEGFLGKNKLTLIVEPEYVKDALEIYEAQKDKITSYISLVDTERVLKEFGKASTVGHLGRKALIGQKTENAKEEKAKEEKDQQSKEYTEDAESFRPGSLAEEVDASEDYVRAYIAFLLGGVEKCESMEALRRSRVGVTADCLLYSGYQLRRLNPENYTRRAYIGEKSMRGRQKELTNRLSKIQRKLEALSGEQQLLEELLGLESIKEDTAEILGWKADMEEIQQKEKQLKALEERLSEVGAGTVERLKEELRKALEKLKDLDRQTDDIKLSIHDNKALAQQLTQESIRGNEELTTMQRQFHGQPGQQEAFEAYLLKIKNPDYPRLLQQTMGQIQRLQEQAAKEKEDLVELRSEYLKLHPGRGFSTVRDDNDEYRELMEELRCDSLLVYEKKAAQQARVAVEHFKEDFVYKIRSAIKEAYVRRDELNRIIRSLNFGKDRYQFKITRNKGIYGEYYDMFMDETLEIDPASLGDGISHQMNMFSMEHENKYGTLMNDLISIFIPDEDAGAKEAEEALQNMERYADYRTYLSFEMEQIVEGEEKLVIGLSKMIKKNSGGEGQNPLYVALLASFAQAYHINQSPGQLRRPTIRLVVLDEAFSKMDAEKVASCIQLIRGLGFQAIISATNDKIQNYLENVDKTFVYANPNKKNISIQEFEKKEFGQLSQEDN